MKDKSGEFEYTIAAILKSFWKENEKLDRNVRAAVGSFDIFDATLPTLDTLEPETLILEVKYTDFLPGIIKKLLPSDGQEFSAISKYILCYDKACFMTDRLAGVVKDNWNRGGFK